MSRAASAYCGSTQTALSDHPDDGAALRFVLKESERLCEYQLTTTIYE